jgi:glycosyltransferase involved in cell wall biosynthesis
VHVGFALLTLFPGRVGGTETNVRGLLGQFADGNGPDRVTVLANRHVAGAYGHYARGPVSLHHVRSYRAGDSMATRLLAMAAARALPRRVARDVPAGLDLVHYPVTVPIPQTDLPRVVSLYDVQHLDLPEFFSRGERLFRRWAYDSAARSATVVITISEYSKRRLVESVGVAEERIEVVHLGIDHSRFTPGDAGDEEVLAPFGLPERFVAYPANMWPHKNHERLIDALALVADTELELVLTGQPYGRLDRVMQRARAAGVHDRVRHLGYLPRDAVPALFRRARGLVFPSLYEGFGSPPLEAMACACPVASSTRGSLGEICGEAALGFDPESPPEIAHALDQLTTNSDLRASLREAGLRRAKEFSWGDAAARHAAIYERAAATRSAPPRL